MTDLFKIISANNYELLEEMIQTNETNIFNCIKNSISLIYRAIEVRAYECFNILIDIPNLTILKNTSHYVTGLSIAVTYYMDAPNVSNKYYLDRLLEKNVHITESLLIKCSTNYDIFNRLLNNSIHTKDSILYCIKNAHNIDIINKIYDWLNKIKPNYYNNTINIFDFNNLVFKMIINTGQICMLYFLKYTIKNVDWTVIDNEPSLYYMFKRLGNNYCSDSLYCNYELTFNWLYQEYLKLSVDELNDIIGIKLLDFMFFSPHDRYDLIKQILHLPIDFNDAINNISQLIVKSIIEFKILKIENYLQKIYLCLKFKLIKINPFNKLLDNQYFINELTDTLSYFNKVTIKNSQLINYLKQLKYLFKYFDFPIIQPFENIFNLENDESFVINQKNCIESFESKYN